MSRQIIAKDSFQATVRAPGFSIGIRCDNHEIHGIVYLEPCAEKSPENPLAQKAVKEIKAYLENPEFHFTLPLRVFGTPFQLQVWREIAAIPCHQTRSYGDLAKALNSAPRAVGQACGANPHPLIVPCHRVIAANGKLGGFARARGGFLIDTKRWLLVHEGHEGV